MKKNNADPAVLDREYIWHPFTPMRFWPQEDAPVIERGEGSYLIDTRGKRYLDGVSSLWVTVHGHNHPRITAAIKQQAERLAHSTMLGERVLSLSGMPTTEIRWAA